MSTNPAQDLSRLLRRFGKNQSLLFLGAGFSLGAKNIANKALPIGKGVIEYFQSALGDNDTDDLMILTEMYVKQFGQHKLFEYLTETFQTKEFLSHHSSIIKFPWKLIYTTNYDDVAEV